MISILIGTTTIDSPIRTRRHPLYAIGNIRSAGSEDPGFGLAGVLYTKLSVVFVLFVFSNTSLKGSSINV